MKGARRLIAGMVLAVVLAGGPAFADCDLLSIGETRPPGAIVFNANHNVVQYCAGTEWKVMVLKSGGGNSGIGPECPLIDYGPTTAGWSSGTIWSDGTYVFAASGTALNAGNWDWVNWDTNANGTLADTSAVGVSNVNYVWGDNSYIYVLDGNFIRALTFDGTSFAVKGSLDIGGGSSIWSNGTSGTPIFVAGNANGLRALTFSDPNWTLVSTLAATSGRQVKYVWGNGSTLFFGETGSPGRIRTATFDGSSLTAGISFPVPGSGGVYGIYGDGTYIYTLGGGLSALSYDGSSFSRIALRDQVIRDGVGSLAGSGGYLYAASWGRTLIYTFDGSSFIYKGNLPTGGQYTGSYFIKNGYVFTGGQDDSPKGFALCSSSGYGDNIPASFDFTTAQTPNTSTVTASSILKISSLSVANVSITGSGNPQYRVCSNISCSSVVQDWTSLPTPMLGNQYLQLRLTSSSSMDTDVSASITVGTASDVWTVRTDIPCTAPADNFIATGTTTTSVPSGCTKATIEAWGAGGGGGFGATAITDRRSGGGGGGSGVARGGTVLAAGGGGGGGSGAAAGTDNGGGGGGYVIANNVAVTSGESLNIYVGAGGQSSCSAGANGAGGAYNGTAGAAVGVAAANVAAPGFGGGGGAVNGNGGSSTYGGGGGNAGSGAGGTSTSGGAGGGTGASNNGAVGVRGTGFGGTVTNGTSGTAGAGGAGATGGGFTAGAGAAGANCANVGGDGRVRVTWLD
ncbi:hypothetical protein [Hyphomicrobium sp. MC8b]|uniref:hypothetical protein n=1 Tax=Hyphomicrobium sp. MC8b TaxID=300273 RepID=UPI00391B7942